MIVTAVIIWLQQIAAGFSVSMVFFIAGASFLAIGFVVLGKTRELFLSLLLVLAGVSSLVQLELPRQESFSEAVTQNKTVQAKFTATSESAKFGSEKRTWVKISELDGKQLAPAILGSLIDERSFSRGASYEAAMSIDKPWDLQRGHFSSRLVGKERLLSEPSGDISAISTLRAKFMQSLSGITPDSKALVAGLAIGERDTLSPETAESMRVTALTHLIAVSGANCAIVMGAVYFLLAGINLGRRWRLIGATFALIGYILLVGPEPSVLRAGVMAFAVIAAMASGRKVPPLQALALSIVVLLIIDPWLATDFAFALSVFSTLGILVLAPLIYQQLKSRMNNWLAVGLAVTFAAQLYCIPVMLMIQPKLPLYGLLANLLAEPVVAPVTIIGISAVLMSAVFPPIASVMSFIASLGTAWIEFLAVTFSGLPAASIPWMPGTGGIILSVLLSLAITFVFVRRRRLQLLSSSLIAVLGFGVLWQTAGNQISKLQFGAGSHSIIQCDVGQGDALIIRSRGKLALVDVGREPDDIASCLKMISAEKVDLLFLSHYDLDHVGGVAGLEDFEIGQVFISGFRDERPAVELVRETIRSSGAPIQVGSAGLKGNFGEFSWEVLAPSKTASETKNSNDASLVVVFHNLDRVVLTLGDLGAVGQERLLATGKLQKFIDSRPLVLKVSHHGSSDQSLAFHDLIKPDLALISVGQNDYGHPTESAIELLGETGAKVLTTMHSGNISVSGSGTLSYSLSGKLPL